MGNRSISKKWLGVLFLFMICISVFTLCTSARIPENEENIPILGYGTSITERQGGTANDAVNAAGDVVTDAAGFVGDVVTDAGKAAKGIGKAVGDAVTEAGEAIGEAFDGNKAERDRADTNNGMAEERAEINRRDGENADNNATAPNTAVDSTRGNGVSWLLFLILIIAAGAVIAMILLPRRRNMM